MPSQAAVISMMDTLSGVKANLSIKGFHKLHTSHRSLYMSYRLGFTVPGIALLLETTFLKFPVTVSSSEEAGRAALLPLKVYFRLN
jgi:hypothetical protein